MRRRALKPLAYMLTLLFLGFGTLPDGVLCVGDDGHRAFELAAQACCHSLPTTEADCTSGEDHCSADCSDLDLALEVMLSKALDSEITADLIETTSGVAVLPVSGAYASGPNRFSTSTRVAPNYNPTPRQRHTTVQLC